MQSETADVVPGAATCRSRPDIVADVRLVLPSGELDETYTSSLIWVYSLHDVIHKTGSA